jgi:hypothetical protein
MQEWISTHADQARVDSSEYVRSRCVSRHNANREWSGKPRGERHSGSYGLE